MMVICAPDDPALGPTDAAALEEAMGSRSQQWGRAVFWSVPEASHGTAVVSDPGEYRRKLNAFVDAELPPL